MEIYLKDNEVRKFNTRDEVQEYLDFRKANDQWYDSTVKTMEVIPASGTAEEFKVKNRSKANLECVKDCMAGERGTALFLKLWITHGDREMSGVLPLRYTAMNTLYNRANISGRSLTRSEGRPGTDVLTPAQKAEILNLCLPLYDAPAKVLYRDGKISAVMSGEYAVIPEKDIVDALEKELADRFPHAEFAEGYVSHEFFHLEYKLHDEEIEEDIAIALAENGEAADKVEAYLGVNTSDVGENPVVLYTYLKVNDTRISFGRPISAKHIGKKTVEDVAENLKRVYKMFTQSSEDLLKLTKVTIHNPAGCLRSIAREFHLPKKTAMDLAAELNFKEECTAYEIYWYLNRIVEVYSGSANDVWRSISLQEDVAETLRIDYTKFDHPFEWARGEAAA